MDIYLGKSGVEESFQDSFPTTLKCHKCGCKASIMFVAAENHHEGKYICQLHENKGEHSLWLHDACAVAVYLCRECFEPNTLINQA